jgi:hypothetical protein
MAVIGAGAVAAGATSLGFFGLLKELVGEAGDLLSTVLEQMNNVVLAEWETTTTKEAPVGQRLKRTSVTTTAHHRITLLHLAFGYCALRMAGVLPPLFEWPQSEAPWWFKVGGLLGYAVGEWIYAPSSPAYAGGEPQPSYGRGVGPEPLIPGYNAPPLEPEE